MHAKVFFIIEPESTGKTMLYFCLMSALRGQCKKVLAIAFTRIAAVHLDGGRTVHSTFGLPFGTLTNEFTSTIKYLIILFFFFLIFEVNLLPMTTGRLYVPISLHFVKLGRLLLQSDNVSNEWSPLRCT